MTCRVVMVVVMTAVLGRCSAVTDSGVSSTQASSAVTPTAADANTTDIGNTDVSVTNHSTLVPVSQDANTSATTPTASHNLTELPHSDSANTSDTLFSTTAVDSTDAVTSPLATVHAETTVTTAAWQSPLSTSQATTVTTEGEERTIDLDPCFAPGSSSERLHLEFSGRLHLLLNMTQIVKTTRPYASTRYCKLKLTVPPDMALHVRIHEADTVCENLVLSMQDSGTLDTMLSASPCSLQEANSDLYSPTNGVFFNLMLTPVSVTTINITVEAVPQSEKPRLVIVYESPSKGYITTPDGADSQYPALMDSVLELRAPADHVTMISLQYLDMPEMISSYCFDRLMLYRNSKSYRNLVWTACEEPRPPPAVYTEVLVFRFVSGEKLFLSTEETEDHYGFRLLFTFHPLTAMPAMTPDGRWNCTVPFWPEFQQHFLCNLKADCVNGEDEELCPYMSEECGEGQVRAGNKCYLYFKPPGKVSWDEASVLCLRQQAILASPSTKDEWVGLGRLVRYDAEFDRVFIGLRSTSPTVPFLYRNMWQFSDGTVAYYINVDGTLTLPVCSTFLKSVYRDPDLGYTVSTTSCSRTFGAKVLCETGTVSSSQNNDDNTDVILGTPSGDSPSSSNLIVCPQRHTAHVFFACDEKSACFHDGYDTTVCSAPLSPLPPSFTCNNGLQHVPYTVVCDHRFDCSDDSDEDFCVFPLCDGDRPFNCGNEQCLPQHMVCDNREDCTNGADEAQCRGTNERVYIDGVSPPSLVYLDGEGFFTARYLNRTVRRMARAGFTDYCPDTHFRCPGLATYCMPVLTRCNGMYDCPGKEDEVGCERYTCPGFYRCRGSTICLHHSQLCDGVFHCPQQDDELQCNAACPSHCLCYGTAFFCSQPFRAASFPGLRYLTADRSAMTPADVVHNHYLVYLSLSNCSLSSFNLSLPNLRSMDLSDNEVRELRADQFLGLPNLRRLSVAGNPLTTLFSPTPSPSSSFPSVLSLDLSRVELRVLNVAVLGVFPSLQTLNLSQCRVERVADRGFQPLSQLRHLDLRGSEVKEFPRDLMQGLGELETVYSDNYKLCCPAVLPDGFYSSNCQAPSDEISSCDALLRWDLYRVFLSAFAFLAMCGNLSSFVYRVFISKVASKLGFDVFVTHLCVADLAMGLYLAIIGVADRLYMGTYLWNDLTWRNSAACKIAGFLSLLSSEVSALIICLITLDRFLVLRFPFSQRLHFKRRTAQVACYLTWLGGAILAAIPLLPVTSHWQFYSQTGICIPLPITRTEFPGQGYSFAIMIAFNFLLFVLIAAGQLSIYLSVRANSMAVSDGSKKSQDLAIAQRLITIAVSDFLCWFPIGLLGMLAASGHSIHGEVNVIIVIFVLPFNSALNPFLYTLNLLLERRRREQEKRLHKMLLAQERAARSTAATPDASK